MRALALWRSSSAAVVLRSTALSLLLAAGSSSLAHAQPPPVSPQDFVSATGGAAAYEIMAAHVALIESRDPGVRTFAKAMIRDHTTANGALRDAALRSGLKPPAGIVGGDESKLLAALQSQGRAEFDRVYLRQQVLAHRSALANEGGYARRGANADLRTVARADMPMIEHHLQEAQRLRTSAGS